MSRRPPGNAEDAFVLMLMHDVYQRLNAAGYSVGDIVSAFLSAGARVACAVVGPKEGVRLLAEYFSPNAAAHGDPDEMLRALQAVDDFFGKYAAQGGKKE